MFRPPPPVFGSSVSNRVLSGVRVSMLLRDLAEESIVYLGMVARQG